ncbi:MAG: ABC transporter substrate-binding protein [Dehalococcoidia bacterium]|nr:ABC transporter substrate-binding protein [Dehalococcoidia bacterium]
MDQFIEGARKEGVVRANIMTTLGEKGAQRLTQALNKKYGLDLKMEYTPTANMSQVVAQAMTELKTGGTPSWDILNGTPMHFVQMNEQGMLDTFDWQQAFPDVPKELVYYGGASLSYGITYRLPTYNPNLVKPADVPRKWEDLVDPKWKGKLAVHSDTQTWERLVELWGEERVATLMEGLAKQDPILVALPQVLTRITSGEYPLAPYVLSSDLLLAQGRGEPVRFAEDVEPALGSSYLLTLPKKALHPNAAKLFIAFSLSAEGQNIWWEEARYGSSFIPQSPLAQLLKGKQVFFNTLEFERSLDSSRLKERFQKILGLK